MNRGNGPATIWLAVLVSCMGIGCTAPSHGPSGAAPSSAATASTTNRSTTVSAAASTALSPDASLTGVLSKSGPSDVITPAPEAASSPATAPPATRSMRPVLVIRWQSTGGSCGDQTTIVPKFVVYADGQVIRTDPNSLGSYCDPVPTFRAGHVDLAAVRGRVETYLRTKLSAVDMSHAQGVFDAGLTVVDYTSLDGSRRVIAADAIDTGLDGMTVDQRRSRLALAVTIADVAKLTPTTTRWTPGTVSVIMPATGVPRSSSTKAPAWPIPVTTAVQRILAGADFSCTPVTGSAANILLTAARTRTSAAATWVIDGQPTFLAIGVVLDGFLPCT